MRKFLAVAVVALAICVLASPASAGILFGRNTRIVNNNFGNVVPRGHANAAALRALRAQDAADAALLRALRGHR